MLVNNVNVKKHCHNMINTIILISWRVSPCIHSSVYSSESGYISQGPSLSFLPKQRIGHQLVIVPSLEVPFKPAAYYRDVIVSPTTSLTIAL
jgi:hypothetical protein